MDIIVRTVNVDMLFWIGGLSILILLFRGLLVIVANNYIKKNRANLYDKCSPLSIKCREQGNELLVMLPKMHKYVNELGLNITYNCSNSVLASAQKNTKKYIIKYSNIENDISCIEQLDLCINFLNGLDNFNVNIKMLSSLIKKYLPFWVRILASKEKCLFTVCDIDLKINSLSNPVFCFLYVSPAGKITRKYKVEITSDLLYDIRSEISKKISRTGHMKAQRSAMTNDLREAIKLRDNYTCCICGNSVYNEPNLLLEVDHIIPVSKGGITEADNLQTLCWRCNRAKHNN